MNIAGLKILCLEDMKSDAELIKGLLLSQGMNIRFDHVENEAAFTTMLNSQSFDLILSDYNLPGFSATAALALAKRICPEVPFICVSGAIGDELAVALMQDGASDYIIKDKLYKLPVAINRVLREVKERHDRIEAEILLRKSEARFRDIIMSSYDWVWEVDKDLKYCYSSETVENILGYSAEEIIGKTPLDFFTEEYQQRLKPVLIKCVEAKEKLKDIENWNVHKDGHLVCLLTNGFPVFDSNCNLIGYRGVDKDITKNKNLTLELIQAKEKAEASDRLKTAFLNNISHEVRTPLNGILGFGELILQRDITPDKKDAYLKILKGSSDRLINTITNYMDISLIVSGNVTVHYNLLNVSVFLNELYEKFEPICSDKNLKLLTVIPAETTNIYISCDVRLLNKSVSHLIDNAIKFTNSGSVTFGVKSLPGKVEIFIKDTGTGISSKSQNVVFDVFMQGDVSDTKEYEGSGLGLSIAKGLVELMNGTIRVESSDKKGSAFFLTFNVAGETKLKKDSSVKIMKETGSPVILIVEDDESNSLFLKIILDKNSYKWLAVTNGKDAVEMCRSHPEISLVLMDIKMPVMNGLEATIKIKEFRKELTIIALTAYAMGGDMVDAQEAGCDDYLTKPVKPDVLISFLKKHLPETT
jgi:PAS domain S-box-containing protein